MKIVAISDTHNKHAALDVPDGDVIIHSGDFTNLGRADAVAQFLEWFSDLPHKYKIFIAGNHDLMFDLKPKLSRRLLRYFPSIVYLQNTEIIINKYKFYGSPHTPVFYNWGFMLDSKLIKKAWSLIPDDTDVLITHGPAYGTGDINNQQISCGCPLLKDRIKELKNLKLHVYGHIHAGTGVYNHYFEDRAISVNAAMCDDRHSLIRKPYVIDLPNK